MQNEEKFAMIEKKEAREERNKEKLNNGVSDLWNSIEKDREKGLFNLPKKIIGSACSRTCLCPVWKAVRGD